METTNYLAAALLGCGYADVAYIERQAETLDIELSDVIDELKANGYQLTANSIISEMQSVYMRRIEADLGVEIEAGKHYDTFTNCLDSHIWVMKDGKPLIRDFGKKKADKIMAHIAEW